jgi:hypothetical protein
MLGTVETGGKADLVVLLGASPVENISNTKGLVP